ncbi:MAG: hypothetical protein LBD02_04370 [Christensenellaceae bacterium]|jgi:hypothetical protein|nr:hypothetical protein [Christensenellaceae bacterium]
MQKKKRSAKRPNLTNATPNTRMLDRFEYFIEDLDCTYCANYRNRGGNGCGRTKCEFQDIRDECIANGRIKRRKGWERDARCE